MRGEELNPPAQGGLLRILGVGFGLAASIGGSIGVGILRAPGIVAQQLPHDSWIVAAWAAGGLFAFLGTLCVIELGTSFPRAGGWYVYAREAFGDFPAFIVGWSYWLSLASALSYASVALSEYLSTLFPALSQLGRGLSVAILLAFFLFQLAGLRPVSRFQEATGYLKGVVFLALAGACFYFAPRHGAAGPPPALTAPPPPILLGVVVALQAVVKTYDGWQTPCFFTEEDRDPRRNLPRSMMGGTLIVLVIYVGLNLAFLSILSVPELAGSKLAAADAFARIFGSSTGRVITALAVLNIAGLLNTLFLIAPRMLFAMARDGMFLRRASGVNPRGVPVFATVFSGAAGLVMLFSGSFERIFAFSTVLTVVCYAGGYASLLVLRRRQPDRPRPFSVWAYPAVPLIALLGSVLLLFGTVTEDVPSALWAGGLLVLSYPVYRLIIGSRGASFQKR